ncbi:hypothetical protein GY21_00480 [Cryobacterium roopkundense]|uniref:LysM domain-containing protein n=1 Tax=Cryobacterium roopkundense TaxID=1001240 RepID=A0A099JXP4_9MICO|nr:hypothetical protein GY21_00480 [Cryobacterium roopkundense]
MVGTLAISLNLAAPAHAADVKKPLNPRFAEATAHDTGLRSATAHVAAAATEAVPAQYSVADGDTVSGIAARFGLTTSAVLSLNGLDSAALIFPGQVLNLTAPSAPSAPATASSPAAAHTVQSGDTIGGIAAANGLSTDAVLSANGLERSSVIYPGQSIVLPVAETAQIVPAAFITPMVVESAPAASEYTIASGDTISAVAATAGVTVQDVLDANGLGWSSMIYPGQVLTIPSPAALAAAERADAVTPLTSEMRQNASTIVAVGRSIGVSDYGLVIALAAAAQESGLKNVDYGDRDSLGLFQQRPSFGWGTPEQVMDPTRATLAFFGGSSNPNTGVTRGLLEIPGWESMTVTDAAQAVQISAFPNHYAKWEISARSWLGQLG